FAGPAGLAALRARSAELPVNFLAPREPTVGPDPGKRLVALVAVAAAVLFVGGLAVGLFLVEQKKDQSRALQAQKTELEDELKKIEGGTKRVKAVADWEAKGVNWLDEIYDLVAGFPDPAGT